MKRSEELSFDGFIKFCREIWEDMVKPVVFLKFLDPVLYNLKTLYKILFFLVSQYAIRSMMFYIWTGNRAARIIWPTGWGTTPVFPFTTVYWFIWALVYVLAGIAIVTQYRDASINDIYEKPTAFKFFWFAVGVVYSGFIFGQISGFPGLVNLF